MHLQKELASQKQNQIALERQVKEAHMKANEAINKYNIQSVFRVIRP